MFWGECINEVFWKIYAIVLSRSYFYKKGWVYSMERLF